ncbi:MAG: exonuclease domain-containing protein [Cyanobacteria bacterium SZAS LIN-2]|nr:exonuclease domain-containing protein [Cyanobacteria bacterium SZAS LIN-2]MBS2005958.1 exonuclease domain-containing protein [Cyanobacteria bacterium SZAS TMP-1]
MKNFNLVNVLDTELTCYPDGVFPAGERSEIIEFGLTTVDLRSLQIVRTISIPVRPTMSTVSAFCTELTGWTAVKLNKQGVSYAEACRRLASKHGGANRLLVTDSNGDVTTVREQCKLMGVEYPFGEDHLNVASLFAMSTAQRQNLGLVGMLSNLGMAFEGRQHRADCDSMNIARVLIRLLGSARGGLIAATTPAQ